MTVQLSITDTLAFRTYVELCQRHGQDPYPYGVLLVRIDHQLCRVYPHHALGERGPERYRTRAQIRPIGDRYHGLTSPFAEGEPAEVADVFEAWVREHSEAPR